MRPGEEELDFDFKLAVECASAYSSASGLGCTVSDAGDRVLFETGFGCASCGICAASGLGKDGCARSQAYGVAEAERFGGKYVYFCPMGLTCLVSPIMGRGGSAARITAGPFLMVDMDDYVSFDLRERLKLGDEAVSGFLALAGKLPRIPPDRVNSLSVLLFMAVGFMNNVSDANRMLEIQGSGAIQGRIAEYIMELKAGDEPPEYPVKTEAALLASIADSDKPEAQRLLNELLGHILFSSGGNFSEIKYRIYELLALISRAAVDAGAPAGETFRMNYGFYQKAASAANVEELRLPLADLINRYIDSLFPFSSAKNADVINKAVHFMRRNCSKKLTLEDAAGQVFLSPAYFSKVFKLETGQSFNDYLNRLRIDKSKRLLLRSDLPLADIAGLSGFEDQSYFTRVFKRVTGVPPNQYRKSGGRSITAVSPK